MELNQEIDDSLDFCKRLILNSINKRYKEDDSVSGITIQFQIETKDQNQVYKKGDLFFDVINITEKESEVKKLCRVILGKEMWWSVNTVLLSLPTEDNPIIVPSIKGKTKGSWTIWNF